MKKKLNLKIGKRRNKMKKDIQELEKKVQKLQDAISRLADKLGLNAHFLSNGESFYFHKVRFVTPFVSRLWLEEFENKFNLLVDELGYEFKENTSKYVIQKKEKE